MASSNANTPYGFRIVRNRNGDFPTVSPYTATANVTLAEGGIARLRTDGLVEMWDGTATNGSRMLLGGIQTKVTTSQTDRTVMIADDPETEYEVQLDDGSVTGVNALLYRNFHGVNMTSRLTTSSLDQSKAALDASTGSSLNGSTGTNVRPFRAIRYSTEVGNVISNSFARVIVKINAVNHARVTASTA